MEHLHRPGVDPTSPAHSRGHYAALHRSLSEHGALQLPPHTRLGDHSILPALQRQVIVGDKVMIMNEAGGLDDPQGLCESIIPEHIHIKRPMNAFMCWAQIARRRLADEKPELRNTELSKILGQMWKELNNDQKTPYIKKAEHLRLQHKTQYPNYKYRPKRKRHSKYAIVPSPEVLHPLVGSGPSAGSSPKSLHHQENKLSHPSYLCNIVKEENISLLAANPALESSGARDARLTYNTLHSYGRHSMSDVLKDAAYYHGYRYTPYYNDLASYTREMGYYHALQPPNITTTTAHSSSSGAQYTASSLQIASPTITSSTTFPGELNTDSRKQSERWSSKTSQSYPIKIETNGHGSLLQPEKGLVTAKSLKISNISSRVGPLEIAAQQKTEVPPLASYIQFYSSHN